MPSIEERLRVEQRKIGQAMPLLAEAADQIDQLKAEIGPLQARVQELETVLGQAIGVLEGARRLGGK